MLSEASIGIERKRGVKQATYIMKVRASKMLPPFACAHLKLRRGDISARATHAEGRAAWHHHGVYRNIKQVNIMK